MIVSVEVLAFELVSLASFMLWSEMFPCRSLWARRSVHRCKGTPPAGQGDQSCPTWTGLTSPVTSPGAWMHDSSGCSEKGMSTVPHLLLSGPACLVLVPWSSRFSFCKSISPVMCQYSQVSPFSFWCCKRNGSLCHVPSIPRL